MLSQRLFGSGAAPAAARRACCSAARPAAAALPRCQGAVRGSLLQQAVRHNSSGSGSKGWKATEPDLAHDIAYQCPPGASLHAAPEGFDASAAAAEEAERYAAIAAMTQPEAEAACEELGVVVWRPQSGAAVPVERLQQHLKDHFTNQQREAVTDPVTNNAAAAAKNAAEAQAASAPVKSTVGKLRGQRGGKFVRPGGS